MILETRYINDLVKDFFENDNVVLYGNEKETCKVKELSELYGRPISYIVNDEETVDKKIRSVYDLIYEDTDKLFVIVCKTEFLKACKILEKIGLRQQQNYRVLCKPRYSNVFQKFPLDVNIGYTYSVGKLDEEYPGITVFKDDKIEESDALKIVTLGGSTSDSKAFLWKCWSQIFYEKLKEKNKNIILYSAGTSGYRSSQELMKLERDMLVLEPDIVISFSGVNDTGETCYPFVQSYSELVFDKFCNASLSDMNGAKTVQEFTCGIKKRKSLAHNWIKHQRMMKAICEEFGIEFYSFLQPMIGNKSGKLSPEEYASIINGEGDLFERTQKFLAETKEIIKKENLHFVNDISDLFDEKGDVYFDGCHVIEEGNYLIANKIYEILEKRKACIF